MHISCNESLKRDWGTNLSEIRDTNPPISLGRVGAQNIIEFRDTSLLIRDTNHIELGGTSLPLGRVGHKAPRIVGHI